MTHDVVRGSHSVAIHNVTFKEELGARRLPPSASKTDERRRSSSPWDAVNLLQSLPRVQPLTFVSPRGNPPSGITLLTASLNCLINSAHCRNIDSHEWGMCALSEERIEVATAPNCHETIDYAHGYKEERL